MITVLALSLIELFGARFGFLIRLYWFSALHVYSFVFGLRTYNVFGSNTADEKIVFEIIMYTPYWNLQTSHERFVFLLFYIHKNLCFIMGNVRASFSPIKIITN